MKDDALVFSKDGVAWLLAAIGISMPAHMFLGGIALALFGACVARSFQPENDRREWVSVLVVAVFAAIACVEIAAIVIPDFPPQLVMAAAGFFSRFIVGATLKSAGLIETKSERIVDNSIDRIFGKDDER